MLSRNNKLFFKYLSTLKQVNTVFFVKACALTNMTNNTLFV